MNDDTKEYLYYNPFQNAVAIKGYIRTDFKFEDCEIISYLSFFIELNPHWDLIGEL